MPNSTAAAARHPSTTTTKNIDNSVTNARDGPVMYIRRNERKRSRNRTAAEAAAATTTNAAPSSSSSFASLQRQGRQYNYDKSVFKDAFTGMNHRHVDNMEASLMGREDGWKPIDLNDALDNDDEDDNTRREDQQQQQEEEEEEGALRTKKQRGRRRRLRDYQQSVEDYMDEHDMNEWGGPTRARREYDVVDTDTRSCPVKSSSKDDYGAIVTSELFVDITAPPAHSIGKRLLRRLGYREESQAAYVPIHDGDDGKECNGDTSSTALAGLEHDIVSTALSSKRLKKIKWKRGVQHEAAPMPPPKLDTYGIGYEPYHNAPEFKLHKERRKREAERRAREAVSARFHGAGDKRYRTSDLVDDDEDKEVEDHNTEQSEKGKRRQGFGGGTNGPHQHHHNAPILAYETLEDFVGTRTVGGFALRDDDDDVYDATATTSARISTAGPGSSNHHTRGDDDDNAEYDMVAYEHSDSDVEEDSNEGRGKQFFSSRNHNKRSSESNVNDFAGALSEWASGGNENLGGKERLIGVSTATTSTADMVMRLMNQNKKKEEQETMATVMTGRTSDGRLPIPGFVLGGSGKGSEVTERFPGPDIPTNYRLTKHVFRDDEDPLTIRQLSVLTKKEMLARGSGIGDKTAHVGLRSGFSSDAQPPVGFREVGESTVRTRTNDTGARPKQLEIRQAQQPMAGGTFAGLVAAMKDRFTTSSASATDKKLGTGTDKNMEPPRAGLYLPSQKKMEETVSDKVHEEVSSNDVLQSHEKRNEIKIRRTVVSWIPSSLLCKRFHVRPLTSSSAASSEDGTTGVAGGVKERQTEASFFEQQILGCVNAIGSATTNVKSLKEASTAPVTAAQRSAHVRSKSVTMAGVEKKTADNTQESSSNETIDRPPMDLFRAIFEPESGSSSSEESETDESAADMDSLSKLIPPQEKGTRDDGDIEDRNGDTSRNEEKNNAQSLELVVSENVESLKSQRMSQAEERIMTEGTKDDERGEKRKTLRKHSGSRSRRRKHRRKYSPSSTRRRDRRSDDRSTSRSDRSRRKRRRKYERRRRRHEGGSGGDSYSVSADESLESSVHSSDSSSDRERRRRRRFKDERKDKKKRYK